MTDRLDVLLPGRTGMVVRVQSHPGMRPAVLDALHRYVDGLATEPGTEMFLVSLDPDAADLVWLHEWFRDDQAQDEHRRAEGFGRLMGDLRPLVAAPPGVIRLDPLRLHLAADVQVLEP